MAKNEMRVSTPANDVKLPVDTKVALNVILRQHHLTIDELLNPKLPIPTQKVGAKYMGYRDAALWTGLSRWTLLRAVKKNELPIHKLSSAKNSKALFEVAELDRWLDSKKQQQPRGQ